MADDLKRTVVWKNLVLDGSDYCSLWQTPEGWLLKGTVIGVLKDQRPVTANYEIHCDENWLTHRVDVQRTIGSDTKSLRLSSEVRGQWKSSGQDLPMLTGCLDVDLAMTPATNILPIRRLAMEIGSSASVIAAWVNFPELAVQPLSQRYTRLTKDSYHYGSNTGFAADITVDDLGLVINYPGVWQRIGTI